MDGVLTFCFLYVAAGPKVAQHAGNHLHKFIVQRQEYREGDAVGAIKQVCLYFIVGGLQYV